MSPVTLDSFEIYFICRIRTLQKAVGEGHSDIRLPGSSRQGKVPDTWFSGSCSKAFLQACSRSTYFSNFYALLKSNSWASPKIYWINTGHRAQRCTHWTSFSGYSFLYKAWEVLQQKCFLHYTILSPYESTWYLSGKFRKPFSNIQLFSKRVLILKFFLFLS